MEEYQNIWKLRAQQHDNVCQTPRKPHHVLDPSCPVCHPVRKLTIDDEFARKFTLFWNWYQPIIYADKYNYNTINELLINSLKPKLTIFGIVINYNEFNKIETP